MTLTAPEFYASSETYQITVRVADPQRTNPLQSRWGFELSARTLGGQQAGTLSPTDDNTRCAPPQLPGTSPCQPTFNDIQYIEHTTTGTRPGTTQGVDFTFNWTAPDASAGPVIFHAVGNAANNSQSNDPGDRIYLLCRPNTSCQTDVASEIGVIVQPQPSGPTPAISDAGVVNLASFAPEPAPLAPGSLALISGTNLTDGSQNPSASFDTDGKLLMTLGGASVKINGIAAPILLAFPGQMVIQIPYQLAGLTTASLVVTLGGQSSPAHTVALDSAAPGIFTMNQGGTGPGIVLIANTNILVAPAGSAPASSRRPAQRGELITIYCTGLGVVNPPVETGAIAGASQTPTPATVTIDGLSADVQYSGSVPGFVGLYKIDAIVPSGARTGDDVELVVTSGGRQSNTVTIAVGP
ncbi:MAG: hypothetical protein HYX73_02790 [Acidobacteria bacterium]|nr:hypothetical protein [Acidobacteriota bacterium]